MAFFQGRALWMVSVSVNGIRRAAWTPQENALAMRVVRRVLEGVGVPSSDRVEQGIITMLVRRQCTDAERKLVREPYLDLGPCRSNDRGAHDGR